MVILRYGSRGFVAELNDQSHHELHIRGCRLPINETEAKGVNAVETSRRQECSTGFPQVANESSIESIEIGYASRCVAEANDAQSSRAKDFETRLLENCLRIFGQMATMIDQLLEPFETEHLH